VSRPAAIDAARSLVTDRFPDARQAWLSGSVVLGGETTTSDLDITVLLHDTEVHRESLTHLGWPVELFVHTEASIRFFVAKDIARRRPTMARLVATGVPLVDGDDCVVLRAECEAAVAAGPGVPSDEDLALARYVLTDQLDDLVTATGTSLDAVAVDAWRGTAELLLAAAGRWSGTGKWLVRELEALDADQGSSYAARLGDGLRAALTGDPIVLTEIADEALGPVGGRLRDGYRAAAALPPHEPTPGG